ncbi:RHS repeat-associated core domain-containing protein [Pseudomonas sp. B28(2017)]|uniref:RHS repeat-associated core domain-containing protein n=1 Tax=Pseudomonas sp. B28(2017) TaxID=1981730 RepID=UPI000A1EED42|nr:RHS repeat-associated core domain-containing protein [Pseudomonas sp. B28(2017)]
MPISQQTQCTNQPSAAQPRLSRTVLLATDLQQSVLVELDSRRLTPRAYCAYGFQSGPQSGGAHLAFNGQIKEPSTGWYHLGNGRRVYNPVLMRFHSADRLSPFGKGGMNAYTYCEGDPLNYTDPTGEFIASVLPIIQRGLTVALHTIAPAAFIFGPKASGAALQATRLSLGGSVTSVVGATMQLVGYPVGAVVQAAGTTALIAGAATRGAVAVKNAYQSNVLWKTVKANIKNIMGWPDSAKSRTPPVTLVSMNSNSPQRTSANIRTSI